MKKRILPNLILIFMLFGMGMSVSIGAKSSQQANTPVPTSVITATVTPTSTPTPTEAPVELTVYSQLSSYWGEQQGWFAKVMLDKFNVILHYVPTFLEEEREAGISGDIIVFGSDGESYKNAVASGRLLDWEENNLLEEHGAYIAEHMSKALEHNRTLTPEAGKVYGFGHRVAPSVESVNDFLYNWDIRWDLYKQLGYPEVKNLEDFVLLLEQMKQLCPLDENGEDAYAMSLWTEWDENLVFYVKAMAEAYYGYEEFYFGLYDTVTGSFYGALEADGPYAEMVKFFNTLYRKGLLDPESRTQSYAEALTKLKSGGTLFSLYQYAGSMVYNTEDHEAEDKYMASLMPEEAKSIAYGLNVTGGNRIWAIGSGTKYPELCMEILNWLCTPEGVMVSLYGPQGVIWDYDEEGNTYFTEFGKLCQAEGTTLMTGEYEGGTYWDGFPQINNVTWDIYSENPDSNGETYFWESWKSNIPEASCEMEQDWRKQTGALSVREYLINQNYLVIPATSYLETGMTDELAVSRELVENSIIKGTWKAIYAESDEDFAAAWMEMTEDAIEKGYTECINFCALEAAKRYALEEGARK